MTATARPDRIPERIVTNRAVALFFVLSSAWSLYLRFRHVSDRFRLPESFWLPGIIHGAAGLALDVLIYISFVIVMLGLFASTRDKVEKAGIVACFADMIIKPIQMLFPACAAAIWWANLGFLLAFLLASVAVLLRLSRPDSGSDDFVDPTVTT